MKYKKFFIGLVFLLVSMPLLPSSSVAKDMDVQQPPIFTADEIHLIQTLSSQNYPHTPDPSNRVSGNPIAIAFGKQLFFDPKLSGDGTMSCSTCHNPSMSWGNHKAITSFRPKHPATRHVPSLWGVKYNRWYFWDGRTDSLWSQAIKPIETITEMAGSRVQVAQLIINTPLLKANYEKLFGTIPDVLLTGKLPATARPVLEDIQSPEHQAWLTLNAHEKQAVNQLFANIGKSIAAFEETLVSRHSPFDDFANSISITSKKDTDYQANTLSFSAQRGLKLFIGRAACTNCHFGPNFSDGEFHHSFLNPISLQGDLGRYSGVKQLLNDPFNGKSEFSDNHKTQRKKLDYVYQNVEFRGQFKTPSLRNISQTFPYMHTGEFKTLNDVVTYYNTISKRMTSNDHQEVLLKSLKLSDQEVNDLVEFLKSLSELTTS